MFERLKRAISLSGSNEAEPPQVAVEQVQNAEDENDDFTVITSLSWDLRVQCFVGSFFLSLLCSVLGSALLFTRRVTGFCVMVSLGSIISLLGTFFLMGPMKQLQKMFERGRFIATFIYLATIMLTLVAGLVLSNPPLALLFVINQYIAMAWYSISYIPFARDLVSKVFCKCFG